MSAKCEKPDTFQKDVCIANMVITAEIITAFNNINVCVTQTHIP